MSELTAETVLVTGGICAAIGVLLFGRYQNSGRRMGGPISRPQLIWLWIVVFGWFVVAPVVGWSPPTPPKVAWGLRAFVGAMAVRTFLELIVRYGRGQWWMPLGIVHTLGCLGWVVISLLLADDHRSIG